MESSAGARQLEFIGRSIASWNSLIDMLGNLNSRQALASGCRTSDLSGSTLLLLRGLSTMLFLFGISNMVFESYIPFWKLVELNTREKECHRRRE